MKHKHRTFKIKIYRQKMKLKYHRLKKLKNKLIWIIKIIRLLKIKKSNYRQILSFRLKSKLHSLNHLKKI